MAYQPCSVPGCYDRKSTRYRFPNPEKDENRFRQWLALIGNEKLLNMDPARIYRNYRVCHAHFTKDDESTNMYLKRTVVPSENLPRVQSSLHTTAQPEPSTSTSHNNVQVVVSEQQSTSSITALTSSHGITHRLSPIDCSSHGTLLETVGVKRSVQLTPKARVLYTRARGMQSEIHTYKSRCLNLRARLKLAEKEHAFQNSSLRTEALNFCLRQLQKKKTKPTGARFTLNEKLMSVALYKTSGAAYRFLCSWFQLPCKSTINRFLQRIQIHAGIDEFIFMNIEEAIKSLKKCNKFCFLIFDEIFLTPSMEYNEHKDRIEGVENGDIVDHALVFMLKGIKQKWKQPICYTFSKGPTKADTIKNLIKRIITRLNGVNGLRIIATICDQGAPNKSAVESLVNEAREIYLKKNAEPKRCIMVNNKEVIPLYDLPHLFKGLRNNLLKKNLILKKDNNEIEASWRDIITAYEIDCTKGDMRLMPHITECHVYEDRLKKMKVSYATQIFSRSVSVAINNMAENKMTDISGEYRMEDRGRQPAQIIMFLNKLFDSLNGDRAQSTTHNILKGAISRESSHLLFWREALSSLRAMYFKEEGTDSHSVPPSLKNLSLTIEEFINITNILLSHGIKDFFARPLNQDALENFFGQMRQHRYRANNINSSQFEETYKTLLIRNLTGSQSIASNCEQTYDSSLIQLQNLLRSPTKIIPNIVDNHNIHKEAHSIRRQTLKPVPAGALKCIKNFIVHKLVTSQISCLLDLRVSNFY